jgi:uncharacterized repeat protein (TIGR01451 family)
MPSRATTPHSALLCTAPLRHSFHPSLLAALLFVFVATHAHLQAQQPAVDYPAPPLARTSPDPATALDGLLELPAQLSPGGLIEFQPLDLARTPLTGTWSFAGVKAEPHVPAGTPVSYPRFRVRLPEDLQPGGPLAVQWRNAAGELEVDVKFARVDVVLPADLSGEREPRLSGCSSLVVRGQTLCVCGYFPDPDSWYGFTLGGRSLGAPVSASATSLRLRVPDDIAPGMHLLEGSPATGFLVTDPILVNLIGVNVTLDQQRVEMGTRTALRVRVDGTEDPVQLVVTNRTRERIALAGGNQQVLSTSGGAINTVVRSVAALSPGAFTLDYRLDSNACACASQPQEPEEPLRSETYANVGVEIRAEYRVEVPAPAGPQPRGAAPPPMIESIIYTITVRNRGRNGAESVLVTNILPGEVTFVSCTATGGGICQGSGNDRLIAFPVLGIGAEETIVITTQVNGSGNRATPILTRSTVSALTPDPDYSDNVTSISTTLPRRGGPGGNPVSSRPRPRPDDPPPGRKADMRIQMYAAPDLIFPGGSYTYYISVSNLGPDAAVLPVALFPMPSEAHLGRCIPSGGGVCDLAGGALLDVSWATMAAGAVETIRLDMTLTDSTVEGRIMNTAQTWSSTGDPNPTNNNAFAIVWVRPPLPLVVIREFRTRGPGGAADEFVTLYNRSNQTVDLSGWRLAVSDATGQTRTLVAFGSGTTLTARTHLVMTNAAYTGATASDLTYQGDIPDDGGMALVPMHGMLGDEVGMSRGSSFGEGAVLQPLTGDLDRSYQRLPEDQRAPPQDTNNNQRDFRVRLAN